MLPPEMSHPPVIATAQTPNRFVTPLERGSDGKRIVAAWFQLIVPLFQKATEGFLDESTPQGGFNGQCPPAEMPLKLPLKITSPDFADNFALLPGVLRDTHIGSCGRGMTEAHGRRLAGLLVSQAGIRLQHP